MPLAAVGHDAQLRQVPQNEVVSELQALARVTGSLSADAGPEPQPFFREYLDLECRNWQRYRL